MQILTATFTQLNTKYKSFSGKDLLRFLPFAVLLLALTVVYLLNVPTYFTFQTFKTEHDILKAFVQAHPFIAPLLFIAAYTLSMALDLPDVFLFSLLGGFLFPQPIAFFYVILSETLGTTIFFLAARHAFGHGIKKKRPSLLMKMKRGFQENAASYLLFLRFLHIFPIWLINLGAAVFNVRLWTFLWTSFIGFLPLAYIYTQAGSGLDKTFTTHETFSIDAFFNTKIKIALIGCAILALVPIGIKSLKYKRTTFRK